MYTPLLIDESKLIKLLESKLDKAEAQQRFLSILKMPYLAQLFYFAQLESTLAVKELCAELGVPPSLGEQLAGSPFVLPPDEAILVLLQKLNPLVVSLFDRGLEYRVLLFHLVYSAIKLDYIFADEGITELSNYLCGSEQFNLELIWRVHDEIIYNSLRKSAEIRTQLKQKWLLLEQLLNDVEVSPENYHLLSSLTARIFT